MDGHGGHNAPVLSWEDSVRSERVHPTVYHSENCECQPCAVLVCSRARPVPTAAAEAR
jgi:hypothetical protein